MQPFCARLLAFLVLATTILAVPGRASAQDVPHSARGSAQFVSDNDFVGTGQATHLGRYTEVGRVTFTPTNDPDVLAVSGGTVYSAANGDQLHATLRGELNTATGAVTVTVTYIGGTGRFATAAGTSRLSGQLLGGGAISIAVVGRIRY